MQERTISSQHFRWLACGAALAAAASLLLAGCAGARAPQPDAGGRPSSVAAERQQSQQELKSSREQLWLKFLADPAASGVDYHTDRITVSYLPAASLPRGFSFTPRPTSQRAAAQANALLRDYHECEQFTDAIASTYGLTVCNQVYTGSTRLAGFKVPHDVDGEALLRRIRTEFASVVACAAFSTRGHPAYVPNDPDFLSSGASGGPQWEMHHIGFSSIWDQTRGSPGIGIATLDSGLNLSHEEFRHTVPDPAARWPDATLDVINHDNTLEDLHGHGSGVSGLIAAEMNDGLTITGAAPNCTIIPIKITNDWFDATDASLIEGLYLAAELGARVVTMSFNWPPSPEIETACNDLYGQGLLLFCSAGNDDSDVANYPAAYPSVISVAATDPADARVDVPDWWGSNYNSTVALGAPGVNYRSCYNLADSGPDAYQDFGGTSGSAPLAGACAALAWSMFPSWTNEELRQALIDTGSPTTGFPHSVPRVDMANFITQYTTNFRVARPASLLAHGQVQLDAEVHGEFDYIRGVFAGLPFQTLSQPPWTFSLDTTLVTAGAASLLFTGYAPQVVLTSGMTLFIDNTPGQFPLLADAEGSDPLQIIDTKQTSTAVMNSLLFLPNSDWSPAQAMVQGPGRWRIDSYETPPNESCYFCGQATYGSYGAYELDCLVSNLITLDQVANPTLVFDHRYNIEDGGGGYDRGLILVSTDYGATWVPAFTHSSMQAMFTGYQPEWSHVEINLAEYAGQQIHIAFCFESDGSVSGENPNDRRGWWVDNIAVAADYASALASVASLQSNSARIGSVAHRSVFDVTALSPQYVGRIEYSLDLYPVGEADAYDQQVTASTAPFAAHFSLPQPLPNHVAVLTARCYGSDGQLGETRTLQIPVFNLLGDANLDNIVDQQDVTAIKSRLGMNAAQAGYSCFMDSNLDGVITEADASAVGYNWGASI